MALISNQDWRSAQNGQIVQLTEEERRTLIAEGYPIPQRFPLSKAEERSLKKIRRKIKNKISAQESRRKKKEYMEELEKKVAQMERQIELLERENRQLKGLAGLEEGSESEVKFQPSESHLSSSQLVIEAADAKSDGQLSDADQSPVFAATSQTTTSATLTAASANTTSDEESFIDDILRQEQQQLASGDQDALMANLVGVVNGDQCDSMNQSSMDKLMSVPNELDSSSTTIRSKPN